MNTDKLLDKIQKLLNLGNDTCYIAEAEKALKKAEELMKQNGISAEDLLGHSKDSVLGTLGEDYLSDSEKQYRRWERSLICSIAKMFDCKILTVSYSSRYCKKSKIVIAGRQSNRITTKLMYNWIRDKTLKEARVISDSPSGRRTYCVGVTDAIHQRVLKAKAATETIKDEWGIVPLDEVEDYLKNAHKGIKTHEFSTGSVRDAALYNAGVAVGMDTSLDKQLDNIGIEYKK